MLFVITGPSGTGKSYLIQQLLASYPDVFVSPPLVTTRPPRQGKTEIDRISVTPARFAEMRSADAFSVTGTFQGNDYGFPVTIREPQSKHVIINTWPALLPDFAAFHDVRFIALTVDMSQLSVLRERMQRRGDDEQTIRKRLSQIETDIADLQAYQNLIEAHGTIFDVSDETTISKKIVPWILAALH